MQQQRMQRVVKEVEVEFVEIIICSFNNAFPVRLLTFFIVLILMLDRVKF